MIKCKGPVTNRAFVHGALEGFSTLFVLAWVRLHHSGLAGSTAVADYAMHWREQGTGNLHPKYVSDARRVVAEKKNFVDEKDFGSRLGDGKSIVSTAESMRRGIEFVLLTELVQLNG